MKPHTRLFREVACPLVVFALLSPPALAMEKKPAPEPEAAEEILSPDNKGNTTCEDLWFEDSAFRGFDEIFVGDVKNPEECKWWCEEQEVQDCNAFTYHPGSKSCFLKVLPVDPEKPIIPEASAQDTSWFRCEAEEVWRSILQAETSEEKDFKCIAEAQVGTEASAANKFLDTIRSAILTKCKASGETDNAIDEEVGKTFASACGEFTYAHMSQIRRRTLKAKTLEEKDFKCIADAQVGTEASAANKFLDAIRSAILTKCKASGETDNAIDDKVGETFASACGDLIWARMPQS